MHLDEVGASVDNSNIAVGRRPVVVVVVVEFVVASLGRSMDTDKAGSQIHREVQLPVVAPFPACPVVVEEAQHKIRAYQDILDRRESLPVEADECQLGLLQEVYEHH